MPYRKKSIDSTAAPLCISGTPNSGFRPYVTPVMIPAGYPINAFLLSFGGCILINFSHKCTKILQNELRNVVPNENKYKI